MARLKRAADHNSRARALNALQDALDLPEAPLRIECYDMAHFQGTEVNQERDEQPLREAPTVGEDDRGVMRPDQLEQLFDPQHGPARSDNIERILGHSARPIGG